MMMIKGKIKWYNEAKGFGFIASENGDDIFVHRSGLDRSYPTPRPEEEVVFEVRQGEKGVVAFNVKPAN
jgi:CspA family cold shock protein